MPELSENLHTLKNTFLLTISVLHYLHNTLKW